MAGPGDRRRKDSPKTAQDDQHKLDEYRTAFEPSTADCRHRFRQKEADLEKAGVSVRQNATPRIPTIEGSDSER